ncbi:MAG: molecular chaperone TorD family protein [Coriobacteriales bacterium]|nr:molecular chaperone TorD family protein [Coriobacteriales bacterium]
MDFLAKLAKRAEETWADNNATATLNALGASEAFLREHLIKWVGLFSTALSKAKCESFFLSGSIRGA